MESRRQFADKRTIRQIVAELNARLGFVPDPEATPEKVREMMRSGGVRPEDNLFSREILHM
ncbi:MAG: hypothetical protein IT210_04840 [Armatimonadetes bacterium]|nr:hypothetical protein [Armatimonadota bacterium]